MTRNLLAQQSAPVAHRVLGIDDWAWRKGQRYGTMVCDFSVLCGSKEMIAKARRWRKVLGGGMRQAGVLAAAGLYALQHNVERLQQDHDNARALAQGLSSIAGLKVDYGPSQTNMVYVTLEPTLIEPLRQYLRQHEMLIGAAHPLRLVTHLDVTGSDIDAFLDAVHAFFRRATTARPAA